MNFDKKAVLLLFLSI